MNNIKEGQKIRAIKKGIRGKRKHINGKVVAITRYFIVVDNGRYRECINKVDLYTNVVKVA